MKKLTTFVLTLLVSFNVYSMEDGLNWITQSVSKAARFVSKKFNQKGYVCDRENKNKYNDIYERLTGNKPVEKMRNNSSFQERTKQANDRTWQTQDFIKRNLEGVEYPNIGALTEAVKNNHPALSLIFLEYVLLALQEGKVVNQEQMNKFLAGKKLMVESIQDIWPELKNKTTLEEKITKQTHTTSLTNTQQNTEKTEIGESDSSEEESDAADIKLEKESDQNVEKNIKDEEVKPSKKNKRRKRKR